MPGARADPVWSEAKDGPRVQEDTWTEVARRLMVLFSSGLRAKAADPKATDNALKEMSYLLRDNVEVITSPPAPEV